MIDLVSLHYFYEAAGCRLLDRISLNRRRRASANSRRPLLRFCLAYFSALETDVKVEFNLVPRPCTTAMIATEMPAAMSPYSMAVAAVSSLRKEIMRFFIANSLWSYSTTLILMWLLIGIIRAVNCEIYANTVLICFCTVSKDVLKVIPK